MKRKLLDVTVLVLFCLMAGAGILCTHTAKAATNNSTAVGSAVTNVSAKVATNTAKPAPAASTGNAWAAKKPDPKQIIFLLGALFGLGSFSAVVLSVGYKIREMRNVTPLPVMYFGEKRKV